MKERSFLEEAKILKIIIIIYHNFENAFFW